MLPCEMMVVIEQPRCVDEFASPSFAFDLPALRSSRKLSPRWPGGAVRAERGLRKALL